MVGLISGTKKEKRIKLKKIISILLCLLISISFISCSKNSNLDGEKETTKYSNSIFGQNNADLTENSQFTENGSTTKNKEITKLYVFYNGIKMDIDLNENDISELLKAQNEALVPDTELTTSFVDIIAVYDDGTENNFGTVFMGEDGGYYLKFANSKTKGAAYKMPNSSFNYGLF